MGTPYPMSDPRGRIPLGRIPGGWEESGYPRFNERGDKLYARLLKNMPGLREAGKSFGDYYRESMLAWGFQERIADRRVFFKLTPGPQPRRLALVVGVHVDDSLSLVLHKPTYVEYQSQWATVFTSTQTA